jgi:hypothetical protein
MQAGKINHPFSGVEVCGKPCFAVKLCRPLITVSFLVLPSAKGGSGCI